MLTKSNYSLFQYITRRLCAAAVMTAMLLTNAVAQEPKNDAEDLQWSNAVHAAERAGTKGPAKVSLLNQATVELPRDMIFIPKAEAATLMELMGNYAQESLVGLIAGDRSSQSDVMIVIRFHDTGYIEDSEAKTWNIDDMLASIKEGTDEDNKTRAEKGIPTLKINGWLEKPNYNEKTHKLVWAIDAIGSDNISSVNYNTYILGRDGYFTLDLISSLEKLEPNKKEAAKITDTLAYLKDKSYSDYVAGSDRVAEYGIAALVTGIAAKKLGLIALMGVFLLKIWKLMIVGALVVWSTIKKIFKRKQI